MPDPIQHVVVLMLENRSFDHFIGAVPGVNGVDPAHPRINYEYAGSSTFYAQRDNAVRKMKPDPKHETPNVLRQIDGMGLGPMGGFVFDFFLAYPGKVAAREQVMSYFPLGSLSNLHYLAQEYCICDPWFSSVPGPTWTNRFFVHSGTSQGWVSMPHLPFHPNLHEYDQTTVYDRLNERGVSWRIYAGDVPQSLLLYNQRRKENRRRYRRMSRFYEDVMLPAQVFPSYVFIEPAYLPFGQNDQHPPSDVLKGDQLIADVHAAIRRNEELWQSTLLIVVWDEHGGFYDHVEPPRAVPPDHHCPEGFRFDRYGVRVPALLISPWVAPHDVFKPAGRVLDHTSILRYVSDKWGLGPLGKRVESAASIAGAIRSTAVDRPESLVPQEEVAFLAVTTDEPTVTPTLNENQAALIDFSRSLEVEIGAPPAEIGLRAMRASSSLQGEVEVAKERVWLYVEQAG